MLQFDVPLRHSGSDVAHKVLLNVADELLSNYDKFHLSVASEGASSSVASELVSDVARFIPDKAYVVRTNMRLQRISGLLTAASCGVPSGGVL